MEERSTAPMGVDLLALVTATLGALASAGVAHDGPRPNIIVVQTDDQDAASLTRRVMPQTVESC